MRILITSLLLLLTTTLCTNSLNEKQAKEHAIENFRQYFSRNACRGHQLTKSKVEQLSSQQCIELLGEDSRFTDLIDEQKMIESEKLNLRKSTKPQQIVGEMLQKAFNRM